MKKQKILMSFLFLSLFQATTSAHFLWVTINPTQGKNGTTNVYFEHGAGPGDGGYLDPFVKDGKTWIRTVENIEPKILKMSETKVGKNRWLSASLPLGAPRSVDSYGKFGVYRYGKTDVLLHYYARNLQVESHEQLHELARAEHMKLDIVPHDSGKQMRLQVLWEGEPVKETMVYILGPNKFRKNLKTSELGVVRFNMDHEGKYFFRTSFEEKKPGTDNGKKYSLIRHQTTMIMKLPLEK